LTVQASLMYVDYIQHLLDSLSVNSVYWLWLIQLVYWCYELICEILGAGCTNATQILIQLYATELCGLIFERLISLCSIWVGSPWLLESEFCVLVRFSSWIYWN